LCREEAVWLSSEASRLGNVKLCAVVKEDLENELADFKPFLSGGELYLDEEKNFYDPAGRTSGYGSLFSFSLLAKIRKITVAGNMKGEGFILGGVIVVGPGDQGLIFEHLEKTVGDRVDVKDVMEAVEKIKPVVTAPVEPAPEEPAAEEPNSTE